MHLKSLRAEMPPLLHLAFPLILGELGWVAMSVVDTVMVGRLPNSALAMAAASLAQVLFNVFVFGVGGILLGLDTLISQAFGARQIDEANRWLRHGLVMAIALSTVLTALFIAGPALMRHLPVDAAILAQAIPAMRGLTYGVLPLMLYFTLRRYLQAAHQTRPIAYALISANLINIALDWLLIFGHRWIKIYSDDLRRSSVHYVVNIPAFGVTGSSWATSLSRVYLFLFLTAALYLADRKHNYGLLKSHTTKAVRTIQLQHLRKLFLLGAPAGASIFIEVGIFALVTTLIATFGPLALAGHEVALQCASTTFMVPFAISAATSVRVGHNLGRLRAYLSEQKPGAPGPDSRIRASTDDPKIRTANSPSTPSALDPEPSLLAAPSAAGWAGILAGAAIMLLASATFLTLPAAIARLFTPDRAVIAAAVPLLLVAAGFQFFDGIQINATGALRGAGNTTAPFLTQIVCYWLVGMPLGALLAFHFHLGPTGLWLGLLIALTAAAAVLLLVWHKTTQTLRQP
jgi:MATE family multidrug resistance protein